MGMRAAQGTKPTQLTNPVPGVDQEEAIASSFNMPQAKPTPMGSPPKGEQPQGVQSQNQGVIAPQPEMNIEDPFADNAQVSDPFAEQPMQDQEFDYTGQEFETKILGSTWKQDKYGNLLVKAPFGKEFKSPSEEQLDGLKLIKSFYVDKGALLGGAAGSVAGAALGAAAPVASTALSTVLGAAGAGIGASISGNDQLSQLRKDPEMSKFLWILEKGSGDGYARAMEPAQAALLAGGSELLGGVVGGMISGQMVKKGEGALVQKAANEMAAKDVAELTAANAEAGDILTAADVASKMPGGEEVAFNEAKLMSGGMGTSASTQYNMAIKEKANKIAEKLKSIIQKVAPNMDFDNPSTLQIAGKQRKGFDEKNIIDGVIDNYNNLLRIDVDQVKELALKKRFDINQVSSDMASVLKKMPGMDQFFDEAGNVKLVEMGNYVKDYYKGDQAAQEAFQAFARLNREKNAINSVYANQRGMSKTPITGSVDMPQSAFQVKDPNASAQFQEALINPDKSFIKNNRAQSDLFGSLPGSIRKELDYTNVEQVGGKLTPGINAGGFETPYNPGGTRVTPSVGIQEGLPLKQRYTINPLGAQQKYMGVGPNASGSVDMGVTYDFINKFTDDLQRIASKSDNPFVKEMAGAARNMEVNVIEEVYSGAGMKERAAQVAAQKAEYSGKIDSLRAIGKEINSNLDNLGGWALTAPASTLRQLKSVLTKKEYSEFAGAALSQGLKDMLVVNPTQGLSANLIEKNFFKDAARKEAMTELIGEEAFKKLESVNKVVKVLESKGLTEAGLNNATDRAAALAFDAATGKATGGGRALSSGIRDFVYNIFGSHPEAQRLLKTKLDNYFQLVKPSMTEEQARAALEFAPTVKSSIVNAGRLTPGSVILKRRQEEKHKFDSLPKLDQFLIGSKNARYLK